MIDAASPRSGSRPHVLSRHGLPCLMSGAADEGAETRLSLSEDRSRCDTPTSASPKAIGFESELHLLSAKIDRPAATDRAVTLHDDNLLILTHGLGDFVWHDQRPAMEVDVF